MSWETTSLFLKDIPDRNLRTTEVKGQSLVLIREGDKVYALEDRCSHDQSAFEGGQIVEKNLECPRHGAWFDYKTGEATGMPAVVGIKAFPTQIRNGEVFVDVSTDEHG